MTDYIALRDADLVGPGRTITTDYAFPNPDDYLRLHVEIAVAPSESTLGSMVLGSSSLNEIAWLDITDDVESIDFSRGAEPGTRQRASSLQMILNNTSGTYSVKNNPGFYGPGTFYRICVTAYGSVPADWLVIPLLVGFVDSWNEERDGPYKRVVVTGVGPLARFGYGDLPAQSPIVGTNDEFITRVDRLITALSYPFECTYDAHYTSNVQTLQGTSLAGDGFTQLFLASDSSAKLFYETREGNIYVFDAIFPVGAYSWSGDIYADAPGDNSGYTISAVNGSLVTINDDERIIWKADLSRVGGTEVQYENTNWSSERYPPRIYTRHDYISEEASPGSTSDLDAIAEYLFSGTQYRPYSIDVDNITDLPENYARTTWFLTSPLDLFRCFDLYSDEVHFQMYPVCGFRMVIKPLGPETIRMAATIYFDYSNISTWSER